MAKVFKGNLVGNQWDEIIDPSISTDRHVGIEIEVENAPGLDLGDPEAATRKPMPGCKEWACIRDNSLRNNGAEFVSFPLPISEVAAAVRNLFEFKAKYNQEWKASVRTGIHVHANVRDFGEPQLQNFLVTFPLIEPALFDYVGREREECIYCVPWYRAPGDAKRAASALETLKGKPFHKRLNAMTSNLAKYSSLFLSPLTRIGTVEFRMAPTWLDPNKIIEWAHICERIVSYSAKCSTYYNVLEYFEVDPQSFVKDVTGGFLKAPPNYGAIVTKLGADILARSLFPESLEEWIRLSENFYPKTTSSPAKVYNPKPWNLSNISGFTKPKIGDKKSHTSGMISVWNGHTWVEDPSTIPHGYIKYNGNGKYKKWDALNMEWMPHTMVMLADEPPPITTKPMWSQHLHSSYLAQMAADLQANQAETVSVPPSTPPVSFDDFDMMEEP